MRLLKLTLPLPFLALLFAFVHTPEVPPRTTEVYTLDFSRSKVQWKAFKINGAEHYGHFNLNGGSLKVKNGQVSGGDFKIDLKSITVEDLKGEAAEKLKGHLLSPDFLGVDAHPTAVFAITNVKTAAGKNGQTHSITGNLELNGITKSVTFPAKVTPSGKGLEATADFTLDRQLWDVNFQTPDAMIKDDVEIGIRLHAKP